MDSYQQIKDIFHRNPIASKEVVQKIAEEDRTKKKRKRKKKNDSKDDMIISFKPLGNYKIFESQDFKKIQLPEEERFCNICPVKFYPIQIEAIRWMYWIEQSKKNESNVGGILADVMGLGKTIDALGIISYDYLSLKDNGFDFKKTVLPTLIITTLTLIHQWKVEAVNKFQFPESMCMVYHGAKRFEDYEHRMERDMEPKIIITNYETVQKDFGDSSSPLFSTHWKRVNMDEAHISRNPKTAIFNALKKLKADSKWCITGTPIMNYPDDVRYLTQICTPSNPLYCGSSIQEARWKNLHLLRRTKEMLPLPKIHQEDVWLELDEEERSNYSNVEAWANKVYEELMSTQTLNQKYQQILLVLVRLRQECDHHLLQQGYKFTERILDQLKKEFGYDDTWIKKTSDSISKNVKSNTKRAASMDLDIVERPNRSHLFESSDSEDVVEKPKKKRKVEEIEKIIEIDEEPDIELEWNDISEEKVLDEKLIDASSFTYSSKLRYILEFVKENVFEKKKFHKIVIFTQFTTMLNLIEAMFIKEKIKCLRFDGRVPKAEIRTRIVDTFNKDDDYRIIIASLKAGGVGLNLVAANCLILVDPWWNSSVELQAFDRVHRIGQKNDVHVLRLLIKKSIEEEVLKIQEKKNNQEFCFFDMYSEKVLSIKDIHCVFNTMRVRQLNKNKTISDK